MKENKIEVTFSWEGQQPVSAIKSDLLPTHELAARELAISAIEDWFTQHNLPVPELVRNVQYVGCEEYQWDIFVLDYPTSIKINILDKIGDVINSLQNDYTKEDLINKFMELYPRDYERYMRQYEYDKNKKKNQMSHPDKLIIEARDIFLTKNDPIQ